MKAYVISVLEDDGGCSDPDCCGEPSYHIRIDKVFSDEVKAKKYLKSLDNYRAEMHEIEVEQ